MIDFKISPGTAGNSDIPDRYDDLPSHNIEVFQSENIQNILDAKAGNQKSVEICYEIKKLSSIDRQNIKDLLGTSFFETLEESFVKCEAQDLENQVDRLKTALKNEHLWFSLTITEKNTTGLLGDETGEQKGSNYHALMRHTNKSEKEGVSGGTFGKGSSVYTYSSGLWLWFAYSVLNKPWKETKVRFAGRGMIAPFIDRSGNQSYDGPLWYSRREAKNEFINGNPQQGLPFTNEAAHQEAEKFGLTRRDESDAGTTYFIPVFWPDSIDKSEMTAENLQKQLRNEILKRWFIPIYNQDLNIIIKGGTDDTTEKLVKQDLYNVPELKYKLEILDWYTAGADASNKKFKRGEIDVNLPILTSPQQEKAAIRYGKKIGHRQNKVKIDLVIRELVEDEKNFKGFTDDEGIGTINRIALARNKGMIVNHYPYDTKFKENFLSIPGDKRFEAILFAGKISTLSLSEEEKNHLEMFLSYAENPAHNEWIHNSQDLHRCNLKRFKLNPTPYPINRVNSIFTKIHGLIAEFFPKDDKPPVKKDICSFWKKLYRLPFAGAEKGGQTGFSYTTLDEGLDPEGRYYWKFRLQSTNSTGKILLQFTPSLISLEGPIKKQKEFEKLGVPEFSQLTFYEKDKKIEEVILEFDQDNNSGIPKEIEIKTCKILKNNFKNLNPVLEISDTLK